MALSRCFRDATILTLGGFCVWSVCGCTTIAPSETQPLASIPALEKVLEREKPIVEPKGFAIVWTNAVLEKEASRATRGFGGMVTFYGEDRKSPVRVDGQLTIYAYDDMSADEEDPTPDRKYVFKPEQLANHYGEGPLGPSYSIWIPWDDVGGPRKGIGLIARFDSAKGTTVMGKPTHNVLEGRIAPEDAENLAAADGKAPPLPSAAKARPFGSDKIARARMKTVTLTVPTRGGQPEVHESESASGGPTENPSLQR